MSLIPVRDLTNRLVHSVIAGLLMLSVHADVVTDWNKALLTAVRADRTSPPKASRAMAITHTAIYDAVNGITRSHQPYQVSETAPDGASIEAAVAAAAYTALTSVFTNTQIQATNFQVLYTSQLSTISEGPAKIDGLAWGQSVAQSILALRANDGSINPGSYTPSNLPGRWKPTPPAQAAALLPVWGAVKPFCMITGSQYRPQTPPPTDTAAYAYEFNTVKSYGGTNSTVRTANQTEVALFWADGAGTATPPGHWNEIAQTVAAARGLTLSETARLFALLNLALADAAICAWDAKYAYDYWRPVTAIREADTDGNPETEADPSWTPLIVTPPFPEYTSGHSTFSRSGAAVLAAFFGSDLVTFETKSDGLPNVIRTYTSFGAAADDAGISRLYGGIHWPSANLHGQNSGAQLGRHVASFFLQPRTALRFSIVARSSGNTQLQLQGEPNRSYLIRASPDLKTWEDIATLTSSDGVLRFTDVNATSSALRFYEASAR